MPNAAHLLETALLILVAFLIGCVLGYVARRVASGRRPQAAVGTAQAASTAAAGGAPLVVAPTIAPVAGARPRSPAERLAAAAGRSPGPDDAEEIAAASPAAIVPVPDAAVPAADAAPAWPAAEAPPAETLANAAAEPLPAPPVAEAAILVEPPQPTPLMQPAHVAGEATSVVVLPPADDAVPPVLPVPSDGEPVRAADIPGIDEAAHVVERPLDEPEPAPSGSPDEDTEAAAMRAIEGGWTPPATSAPRHPVQHPEAASAAEVDAAMASARSAVASAAAAAAAVIAERADDAPIVERADEAAAAAEPPAALNFDVPHEAAVDNFLEDRGGPDLEEEPGFEPARPAHGFGRPEALPSPRDGASDDLKQIRGVSPQLEAALNGLGIFHLDQVAAWDQKAVVWLDNHLGLRGRIGREKWIDQARGLQSGRGQPARPVRR